VLTLTNIQLAQSGEYAVSVTNLGGSVISSNATLTVNAAPPCDPAPSGLVSWWPAEGSAVDIVGTNNGALTGGAGYTNGLVGEAFSFTGTGQQVSAATGGFPTGTNSRTMECWVFINSFLSGAESFFAGYGNFGNNGQTCQLGADENNVLYFSVWGQELSGPTLTSNHWYHIAVTSAGTNQISLYLDGTNVASGSLPLNTPAGTKFYIGGVNAPFATRQLIGLMDELGIYNRALASNEIAAIYNAGRSGKCPLPPGIVAQPTNQTVQPGGTAVFSVVANGTGPLSYQWSFNGTNLNGSTGTSLTLVNVQPNQGGVYTVSITNAGGSILSSNAVLTVGGAPSVTQQPAGQTNFAGQTATFTSASSGTPPLAYQWYFNGTNIPAATNTVLTLANLQLGQSGNYYMIVTNGLGSARSSNALLQVNPLFSFVWQPVASPKVVGVPFAVTIDALATSNSPVTNFTGTVALLTTNGVPVQPAFSGNFTNGAWTGTIILSQPVTNLVLESLDGYGETGFANAINIASAPSLASASSGGTLFITWPVYPSGFVLESSPDLSPASWVRVGAPPLQVGNQYLQSISITSTNAFYRLVYMGQ
jgi:hypothetical protein